MSTSQNVILLSAVVLYYYHYLHHVNEVNGGDNVFI